jgi:hypothetical protein
MVRVPAGARHGATLGPLVARLGCAGGGLFWGRHRTIRADTCPALDEHAGPSLPADGGESGNGDGLLARLRNGGLVIVFRHAATDTPAKRTRRTMSGD